MAKYDNSRAPSLASKTRQKKMRFLSFIWLIVFVTKIDGTEHPPCCPPGQYLDLESKQCFDGAEGENGGNATDPSIECSSPIQVMLKTEPLIPPGNYCIQHMDESNSTHFTVLYCSHSELVIKKCCPFGESIDRSDTPKCIKDVVPRGPFDPVKWIDSNVTELDYQIKDNVSITCQPLDYHVYLPGTFADHVFKVQLSSGQLIVPLSIYHVFRESDKYCVDHTVNSMGKTEPVAVTCLSKTMEILRFIIRDVFPYTHFFSAGFLLVTLVVYLILPPLRDNIQGLSMICFLFCMLVVQTEYGVILAIPYEPHTWCFPKVWISTYFRYASSTWITVMGFNIWSQLSNGPRRFTRVELIKRFAWCSLYAWGLAFILNMAVVGYIEELKKRQIMRGGVVSQRCWFGNRVLSHLLSTPNVILVTANLIFFIPSAIYVYGSLKFLRSSVSSPVALSKLERDRIKTIFRFFLLMQFYTIPRIIHEIVDTDKASPELLVASVSLYCFIGPAMFGFFVCKREVLKLLSELLSGKKGGQLHTTTSQKTSSSSMGQSIRDYFRSISQESQLSRSRKTSTSSTLAMSSSQPQFSPNQGGQDNPVFSAENEA